MNMPETQDFLYEINNLMDNDLRCIAHTNHILETQSLHCPNCKLSGAHEDASKKFSTGRCLGNGKSRSSVWESLLLTCDCMGCGEDFYVVSVHFNSDIDLLGFGERETNAHVFGPYWLPSYDPFCAARTSAWEVFMDKKMALQQNLWV